MLTDKNNKWLFYIAVAYFILNMAPHTAILPASVYVAFWPILIKHFQWKNKQKKNTHQICFRLRHWRVTAPDHILQAGLPHFVELGFNRRALGRGEKRCLADVSRWWRQCDVLKKMRRGTALQSRLH